MTLDVFRYRLPLTAPLTLPSTTLTHRTGLLLRLDDGRGNQGWGDVAPLPGFSHESLGEAEQALLAHREQSLPPAGQPAETTSALARQLGAWDLPASVHFGIELAAANLYAAERASTLPQVLSSAPADTIAINALLTGEGEPLLRDARRLRRHGYRTVKLKVGRRAVADDVQRVHAVRQVLGPRVALRLDANRAWSWDAAAAFAEALRDVAVEYVEEPLAQPDDLLAFAAAHPHLPLALDETTREHPPSILRDAPPVRAVVLKPTLLGGIGATARWAASARAHGARIVLSTSFESGIGLLGLVALAAAYGGDTTAHGLGAHDRLAADVLHPFATWRGDRIDVAALFASPTLLNEDYLEPVG